MRRFNYFSADDAKRLVNGEVSEVVVSDDTTILFNSNKFWYKQNGDEYDCDIPNSFIRKGEYDAIAKDIRVETIYPLIKLKESITSILTIDNSELTEIRNGKYKRNYIHCNPYGRGENFDTFKCGELFYDKDNCVFVARIFDSNDEYELGYNVMETLTEIFHMLYPVKTDDEYMELEEYIGRAWSHNQFNFEVSDIEGNTWYSCNKDEDGNRLPIMYWHIGNSDRKMKKYVGDVVNDYYSLLEKGYILNSMLFSLMMDMGE